MKKEVFGPSLEHHCVHACTTCLHRGRAHEHTRSQVEALDDEIAALNAAFLRPVDATISALVPQHARVCPMP